MLDRFEPCVTRTVTFTPRSFFSLRRAFFVSVSFSVTALPGASWR